ncbi:hypothetical protein BDZ97DRAFT_572819 [Flammula alnicola]|nr:hypothetical protein BDZ97DRAFT_572819 [Flammula alnicola]
MVLYHLSDQEGFYLSLLGRFNDAVVHSLSNFRKLVMKQRASLPAVSGKSQTPTPGVKSLPLVAVSQRNLHLGTTSIQPNPSHISSLRPRTSPRMRIRYVHLLSFRYPLRPIPCSISPHRTTSHPLSNRRR